MRIQQETSGNILVLNHVVKLCKCSEIPSRINTISNMATDAIMIITYRVNMPYVFIEACKSLQQKTLHIKFTPNA